MDFLEGVVGRFRNLRRHTEASQPPPPLERKSTPRVWTYEHFREYMLALGRGENYLLPIDQYPDIIELGEGWHQSLEDSRKRTDGSNNEHYFPIGFKDLNRSLHLPNVPYQGEEGRINSDIKTKSRGEAWEAGISIVGDVHTHPGREHLAFSVADMYGVVVSTIRPAFTKGVVGDNETLFAFRTRETVPTHLNPETQNQKSFCKYWYESNGWEYVGNSPKGEKAMPIGKEFPSVWTLNQKIAAKHKLVLYSGDPHGELVKVFPVRGA